MRRVLMMIGASLLVAAPLRAGEKNVKVRATGKELRETEPGQTLTAVFRVTNETAETREFDSKVELPENWKLITGDFPFQLNADESDVRIVGFYVPKGAPDGKYRVRYAVHDREHPSLSDFYFIQVVVLPVTRLEVVLAEAPEFVIAGEDYRASFIVINGSNVAHDVAIDIASGEGLPFITDAEALGLARGESKRVTVRVKTDEMIRRVLKHHLRFTARIVGNEKVKANASCCVEIVPRITGVEDRYHRIPTKLTFRYVSEEDGESGSGFQTELAGSGKLDEEGKKRLEFLFRSPDIQDESVFGERDECYLGYRTEKYEIYLGDRSYSLSPLTQNYRYGRGAEGKLNLSNLTLGAWYQESRWVEPEEKRSAGYLDYQIGEHHSVGLNYLRKNHNDEDADIISIEGRGQLVEDTDIEFEYATGKEDGEDGNAYLTRVYGYSNGISYYLRFIHADPDYPGYYSDMELVSVSLAFPIANGLRLSTQLRQEKDNLDLDPNLASASAENYYDLGLDYKFKTGTWISLDWRTRVREDRLPDPEFDYEEQSCRLGIGHGFKKLSVSASAETGKRKDMLDNENSELERYTASVYFTPTNKQSYNAYVYYDDNSDSTGRGSSAVTTGANASFRITERTLLDLYYQTRDHEGSDSGDRDNFEAAFIHTLPNENSISVRARHFSYGSSDQEDETAVVVEYVIPFGLPVSRKKNSGVLTGHLYDRETRKPIRNAILRLNGATAVTDSRGKFTFPSLRPGSHYLAVDTASVGLNRVTVQKTPMAVSVEGGKETSVEIGITRAVSLFGRVAVYQFENNHNRANHLGDKATENNNTQLYVAGKGKNGSSLSNVETTLVEAYSVANILVEIRNGSAVKRRVTDRRGRFVFEELPPGKWVLKVHKHNLPDHHYFQKDEFDLELAPGGKKEILVRVLPKKRPIRMIANGGTLVQQVKEQSP